MIPHSWQNLFLYSFCIPWEELLLWWKGSDRLLDFMGLQKVQCWDCSQRLHFEEKGYSGACCTVECCSYQWKCPPSQPRRWVDYWSCCLSPLVLLFNLTRKEVSIWRLHHVWVQGYLLICVFLYWLHVDLNCIVYGVIGNRLTRIEFEIHVDKSSFNKWSCDTWVIFHKLGHWHYM